MKRIVFVILTLAFGLAILAVIFYIGDYATETRMKNRKALEAARQGNFDFRSIIGSAELEKIQRQFNVFKKEFEKFLILLPLIRKDVELKNNLLAAEEDWKMIKGGYLFKAMLQGGDQPLFYLKDLYNRLAVFEKDKEKYHLDFITEFKEKTEKWLLFFGEKEPRRYLILFQKPEIARPTGGFLGTYAVLTFEKGEINLKGGSIYDFDDLLTEKIIPPAPLKHIANKWFFHDANWFFDFSLSAKKIMEFYSSTGLEPALDGVMAVNDDVIANILKTIGQVELKEHGLIIDYSNYNDFFFKQIKEGAKAITQNQSRKIFSVFLNEFYKKMKSSPSDKLSSVSTIFIESLAKKDIQIYSADEDLEHYFDFLGWAGKISESPNDYLAAVFNNLEEGFTEDNRQKIIKLESKISENEIINTLFISAPFDGKDKNRETYLKIYLPEKAIISEAKNGYLKKENNSWPYYKLGFKKDALLAEIESTKTTDKEKGIEFWKEGSKTVIGTWTKLSFRPFELVYKLPSPEIGDKWEIHIQKQSGQDCLFSYNLITEEKIKIKPTLFSFKKAIPLEKDLILNFQIER